MSIGGPGQPPGPQKPGDNQSTPVQGSPDLQPGGGAPTPYVPQIPAGNGYQYQKPLNDRLSEVVATPVPQMSGIAQPQALAQATASAYGSMDKLGGMASYWNGLGTVINNFGNINMGQAPALGVPLGCVQGGALMPATTFPQMSLGAFHPTVLTNALAAIQQQQAMLFSQLAQTMSVVQSLAAQYSAAAMPMPAFQPTPMAIPLPMAFQHIHAFGTGAMPPPLVAYPCQGYQGWGAFEGQHFLMPPMLPHYFDPRWLEQHAHGAASGDDYFCHCYRGFNSADKTYQHASQEPRNSSGGEQIPDGTQSPGENKKSANVPEMGRPVREQEERRGSEQELIQCCLTGDLDGVKKLFDTGAIKDVNKPLQLNFDDGSHVQVTPLILAARNGNESLELVKYLTEKGADSSQECDNRTPLIEACKCKDDANEVISHLAKSGANIFHKDKSGNSLKHARFGGNEKNMQAVLESAGVEKERLVTEADLKPEDFARCSSSQLKSMVGYKESLIPDDAKAEYDNFISVCQNCAYEQLTESLGNLKKKWGDFNINAHYDGQRSPLEMVCSSQSQDLESFRRKLITIHRLKQNGAVFNPSDRAHYATLIRENNPDQRKLIFNMLAAPTGKDLQSKVRIKKDRYDDKNVVAEKDRLAVDPDKHLDWFAEGTGRKADIEAWDRREYRITPHTEQGIKRQEERLENALEATMLAQREDERNNVERDLNFLEVEPDITGLKLCVPETKRGVMGFLRKKEPNLGVGVAMIAAQGQKEAPRVEDIHIEATIEVDDCKYEMSTLLDHHGPDGLTIARFVKEELPRVLEQEITEANEEGRPVSDAFKLATVKIDRMLAANPAFKDSDTSGVALNMAITVRNDSSDINEVWAVNLGDAETILIRPNGTAQQLSMPTAENRSIGDGILGEGKSARAKVFRMGLLGVRPEDMTLIQCSRAMREQVGPHGMAALAGKLAKGDGKNAGQLTAQDFSAALVSRGAAQRQEGQGNLIAVVKRLTPQAKGTTPLESPVLTPETVRAKLKLMPWGRVGQEDIQKLYEEISSWEGIQPGTGNVGNCLQELYVELQTTYGKYKLMPEELEKVIEESSPRFGPQLIKLSKATNITELEEAAGNVIAKGYPLARLYYLKKARFAADMLEKSQSMKEGLKVLFSTKPYAKELLMEEALDPRARLFLKDMIRSDGWLSKYVIDSDIDGDSLGGFEDATEYVGINAGDISHFVGTVQTELEKKLVPFVVADEDTPLTVEEIIEAADHREVTYRLMRPLLDEQGMLPQDKGERQEQWKQVLSLVRKPAVQQDDDSAPDVVETVKKESNRRNIFADTIDLDAMPSTEDESPEVPEVTTESHPLPVKTVRRSKLTDAAVAKRVKFFLTHEPGDLLKPAIMIDEFLEKGGDPTEKVKVGKREVSLLNALFENEHMEAIERLSSRWPAFAHPNNILEVDKEVKLLKKTLRRDDKGEIEEDDPKNEGFQVLKAMRNNMVIPVLERYVTSPDLRTGNQEEDVAVIEQMLDRLPNSNDEKEFCTDLIKNCCKQRDATGILLIDKALRNRGEILLKDELADIEDYLAGIKGGYLDQPDIDFSKIDGVFSDLEERKSKTTKLLKHIHEESPLEVSKIKQLLREGGCIFVSWGRDEIGYKDTLEKLCERSDKTLFREVFQLKEVGGRKKRMDDKHYKELTTHLQKLASQGLATTYPDAKDMEKIILAHQRTQKRDELLERFKDSDDVVTYAETEHCLKFLSPVDPDSDDDLLTQACMHGKKYALKAICDHLESRKTNYSGFLQKSTIQRLIRKFGTDESIGAELERLLRHFN